MWNLDSRVHDWTKGRFVMSSGCYAGRGPNRSDLNPSILEMLYQGIKQDIGPEEAANFVRFVNQLDDLSASAFVVAFEQFAANSGQLISVEQHASDGMRLDARGEGLMAQSFGAIMSAFGGQQRSEEELRRDHGAVKNDFVHQHWDEIPEDERRPMEGLRSP